MTGEAQSAVSYRSLIRASVGSPGSGEDLANINTSPLPNGSQCYVVQTRSLYRLVKTSDVPVSGLLVIAPIAGPGRWMLEGSIDMVIPAYVYNTAQLNNSFLMTGEWVFPATTNFQAQFVAGLWQFQPSGLALTYLGPTVPIIARLVATMSAPAGETPISVGIGISVDEDLSGGFAGNTGGERGGNFYTQRANEEDVLIATTQRRITSLAAGQALQAVFAGPISQSTGTIYALQWIVEPG